MSFLVSYHLLLSNPPYFSYALRYSVISDLVSMVQIACPYPGIKPGQIFQNIIEDKSISIILMPPIFVYDSNGFIRYIRYYELRK